MYLPPSSRTVSTRNRPSGSREHGGSPLRQAGQAQAGDEEFENFRCHKVSVPTIAGDGKLGVDGKHATEFGACRVEPAEMRQGDGFDPHRWGQPRLVVQGAGPPFGAACGGAQETGRVSKDARWRRHDKEAGRGRSLTSELA